MRQKIRFAALVTAAVVTLTGTALAVATRWDVLQAWFDGDTSVADGLVDRTARSVTDKDYTFTVESSISDGASAFLLVRIDARNPESAAWMVSDDFNSIDTFNIHPLDPDPSTGTLTYVNGGGTGYSEVTELRTDVSSTWRVTCDLPEDGSATAIHARMGYMEKGLSVEVPMVPVEAVTLDIGVTGQGSPSFDTPYPGAITLEKVVVSPFTLRLYTAWEGSELEQPALPILFRMADGSLRGFSEMTEIGGQRFGAEEADGVWHGDLTRRFREVQDFSQLSAVVVWGMEYPLDGGTPHKTEVDSHLLPFTLPLMEGLSEENPYSIPVRALCDGLGATCDWDNDAQTATLRYRDSMVVLTWKSTTALVDGKTVELTSAPDVRDGKLCVDGFLSQVWNFYLESPMGEGTKRLFWVITP